MSDESPPIRPRIEQFGEKAGAVLIVVLVVGLFGSALLSKKTLDGGAMLRVLPTLAGAALLTLGITTLSYFGGMALGFVVGWAKSSRHRLTRGPSTVWVESFRGTPFFVQLLLLHAAMSYYNPGNLDIDTRVFITGVVALFLNTSAYQAEIFRAGLQSVHAGQVEAARSIGMSQWGAMKHVILPQAVRIVVPPLMNEYISLLKASAILAFLAVPELTYQAKIATSFGQPWLEISLLVTILYLLMTVPLAKVVGFVERRFRIPGLGMHAEPVRHVRAPRAGALGAGTRMAGMLTSRPRGVSGDRGARNVLYRQES